MVILKSILKNKLLLGLILGTMMMTPAFAQSASSHPASGLLGIIDMQVIEEKSTAIQKVREQLDKKAEEFKADFTKKEGYFKKKYEDLEKQKSVLSKEAFEQKNNELSKEFNDAQKKVQENRSSLDMASMEAIQQFSNTLTGVVKEEAGKIGCKVVLRKEQTLYADSALEITTQVLENLNKTLPTLTVKF